MGRLFLQQAACGLRVNSQDEVLLHMCIFCSMARVQRAAALGVERVATRS